MRYSQNKLATFWHLVLAFSLSTRGSSLFSYYACFSCMQHLSSSSPTRLHCNAAPSREDDDEEKEEEDAGQQQQHGVQ